MRVWCVCVCVCCGESVCVREIVSESGVWVCVVCV